MSMAQALLKEEDVTMQVSYEDTCRALERIRRSLPVTPLTRSEVLSELTSREVYLKWDNKLQTGSFKERGAVNVVTKLFEENEQRTVCAASAGNHALALSHHSRRFGLPCVLVMPKNAPLVKVQSAQSRGATVILEGQTFDDSYAYARSLASDRGYVFVSPFDDPLVIAGQSTLAHELLEQLPDFDSVIVPVGGGGLISGISLVIKERRPDVHVLGVQSEWVNEWKRHGHSKHLIKPVSIADGIAVKKIGDITGPIIERNVDKLVTLSENAIASSMITLLETERAVVEGAGAAALGGLLQGHLPGDKKKVVVVISGSNIDMNVLSRLIAREVAARGRLLKVRLSIPDRPGSLHMVSGILAQQGANILEVLHDRSFSSIPGNVEVTFTLEVRDIKHRETLLLSLEESGIPCRQI